MTPAMRRGRVVRVLIVGAPIPSRGFRRALAGAASLLDGGGISARVRTGMARGGPTHIGSTEIQIAPKSRDASIQETDSCSAS